MNHHCELADKECIHCFRSDIVDEVFCGLIGLPVRVLPKCAADMPASEKRALHKRYVALKEELRAQYVKRYNEKNW